MERELLINLQTQKATLIKQASFLSKQKALVAEKYADYSEYSEEDKALVRSIQKVRSEIKSKLAVLNFLTGETGDKIVSINFKDISFLKKRIGLKGFDDVR